jgi:enoyl-CoA hydratase/carnithine racemase
MTARVTANIADGVADVRLARPEKLNALDQAMFEALIETGERLKTEAGVRAVVLSGEGRGFCAGLDLERMASLDAPSRAAALLERGAGGAAMAQQAVMVWRELPAPVIAAVHGMALGGGFQLTLGCDLRFVAPDARLSVMEIKWGLVPDMGGVALLPRLVRGDVARDLTWSGRMISGQEAFVLGLATRVCADPRGEALSYARQIAAASPDAIRAGKRLFNLAEQASLAEILLAESREQVALIGTANQREAVAANLGKRPPNFTD